MSSSRPNRLAIIGCGAVVQHHLLPALRRIGWNPAVLIDPSQANLEATSRRTRGTVRMAADWSAAAADFDAAIVAAPHVLHGSIGLGLLHAGKHVFMEKPLAITHAECNEMLETARAKGGVLSVGLLRRYLHIARWTKSLLTAGVLGEIRRFDAQEGFVFNWAISTDALLRPDMAGGGVLMDTGAHTLDLLSWWFGDLKLLDYRDDSGGGVEADCVLDCALAGGGSGRLTLSRSRNLPNTCRIEGTHGFAEVHLYENRIIACSDNARAFVANGMAPGSMPEQRFPELFSAELADFRSDIDEGTANGVCGREGIRSVALIERCYQERRPLVFPWIKTEQLAIPLVSLPQGAKVVVTGATGFIGGRLVESLLGQGSRPRCLVRSSASAVRLARLPVEIQRLDLADEAAVRQALDGADYVFHCAHDFRSRAQNIAGAKNIVATCTALGIRRLVYVSTFSVYEPFPDGVLTEETRDGDVSAEYTRTKLDIEQAVLQPARDGRLNATVVQPTIVYGPFSKPWTIAPAEMLLNGTVILPDQGNGLCNAVYVDDVVTAMLLAAMRPEAIGERFLVSGPAPVSWQEFFQRFAAMLGRPGPQFRPAQQIARENSGVVHDLKLIAANPKKIIQLAVRVGAIRTLLQNGLDSLPKPLYDTVTRFYFAPPKQQGPLIHLPNPSLLRLYAAQAVASNAKATRLLGYAPAFDFAQGMELTGGYLCWAYPGPGPAAGMAERVAGDLAGVE